MSIIFALFYGPNHNLQRKTKRQERRNWHFTALTTLNTSFLWPPAPANINIQIPVCKFHNRTDSSCLWIFIYYQCDRHNAIKEIKTSYIYLAGRNHKRRFQCLSPYFINRISMANKTLWDSHITETLMHLILRIYPSNTKFHTYDMEYQKECESDLQWVWAKFSFPKRPKHGEILGSCTVYNKKEKKVGWHFPSIGIFYANYWDKRYYTHLVYLLGASIDDTNDSVASTSNQKRSPIGITCPTQCIERLVLLNDNRHSCRQNIINYQSFLLSDKSKIWHVYNVCCSL